MARIKLLVDGYRCERCGWEWLPRIRTDDPGVCPKCKSPWWDTPAHLTSGKYRPARQHVNTRFQGAQVNASE